METIGKPIAAPGRPVRHVAASTAVHLLLIAAIAIMLHRSVHVAPYRLPGSEHGSNLILAYLPGRAPLPFAAARDTHPTPADPKSLLPLHPAKKSETASTSSSTVASPQPDSTTGADALGSGNITIALPSYYPPPHPDLSAVPRGTKGDVILMVVIDTDGRISEMKPITSYGFGVDETVIATVRQWTFHPAMQEGHPVPSEQELHFHYERP